MLNLSNVSGDLIAPITRVVDAALEVAEDLAAGEIMVVGAWCRDIMHNALGHTFSTTATRDLDIGLALTSWSAYHSLARAFSPLGDTGIQFRIADIPVDLLPFGGVEEPQGTVEPPSRGETLSVWAFDEIFAEALPLAVSPETTIRIPSVAGYAASKLGAWLDRSEYFESKDASDLALILHWYAESAAVHDHLYETAAGNLVLIMEGTDLPRAAARLLGQHIASTIGSKRVDELLARWPGNIRLLTRELTVRGAPTWPLDVERRRELLDALTRGLERESK